MRNEPPRRLACPFSVVVDTRETKPYLFSGLLADSDHGNIPIEVTTVRYCLAHGDYQVFGLPAFVVERKSKEDLFGSVARRDNFIGRLERITESGRQAAVVVESEWSDILARPPHHSKLNVKALARTIQAWTIRYPAIHWHFLPGREAAEAWTFRLLERFWKDHKAEVVESIHDDGRDLRVPSIGEAETTADYLNRPCPLCGTSITVGMEAGR